MNTACALMDPSILFFLLGIGAGLLRSNLLIPPQMARFLALYLLMAIGLKGGFALAKSGFGPSIAVDIGMALSLAVVIPIVTYAFLKKKNLGPECGGRGGDLWFRQRGDFHYGHAVFRKPGYFLWGPYVGGLGPHGIPSHSFCHRDGQCDPSQAVRAYLEERFFVNFSPIYFTGIFYRRSSISSLGEHGGRLHFG